MAEEFRSGSAQTSGSSPPEEGHGQTIGQTAREEARATWNETREGVRSAVHEQQQSAAQGVDEVAGALRAAAHQLDERHSSAARVVASTADGLQRLSGTLRGKDVDSMVREVQSFARREPALFLGGAILAGFVAMRLLSGGSLTEAAARGAAHPPPPSEHLH